MQAKEQYLTPDVKIVVIRMEDGLLVGSVDGAQSEGFTSAGEYSDDDWSIN